MSAVVAAVGTAVIVVVSAAVAFEDQLVIGAEGIDEWPSCCSTVWLIVVALGCCCWLAQAGLFQVLQLRPLASHKAFLHLAFHLEHIFCFTRSSILLLTALGTEAYYKYTQDPFHASNESHKMVHIYM